MLSHAHLNAILGLPLSAPGSYCLEPVEPLGHRLEPLGTAVPIPLRAIEVWACPACDRVIESIGPVPVGKEYRLSTAVRPGKRGAP